MDRRSKRIKARGNSLKATGAVMVVIFISKAVGFLREIIQAQYLGRGDASDAFSTAYGLFYIPILLFSSCITSTLVPMYIQMKGQAGRRKADRFASNVIGVFALFAFLLSGVMMLFTEPIIHFLYPGFSFEKQSLIVELTRIMLPSLMFTVLSLVLSSILNAQEHYIAAQLTGFPLSACVIFATVLFVPRYGVYAIAWGVFVAGIFQALIQMPPLAKSFRYSPTLKLKDENLKRMFALAVPAILSMAVNEINHQIDYSLASGLLEGDITSLKNAYSLITLIIGVIAVPLTTITFSKMSMRVGEVGVRGVVPILKRSMELLAAVLLPVTAVSAAFSREIVSIAFMRGAYSLTDAYLTGDVFLFYVIGVLAYAYRDIFNRAFHAAQDTRTPMSNAMITMLINVVLNLVLRHFMGVNGLALSTSIASIIGTVMLLVRLRKHTGRMGLKNTAAELLKIGIASALCAYVCLALNRFVPAAQGNLNAFFRFFACAAFALIVYVMALFVFGSRQLDFLTRRLRKS